MADLAASTVGPLLRDRETRAAALDALDAHAVPIERSVSLGAAPALGELLALDATEVVPAEFDRVGLLLARLVAEASDDPASVYGAAWGEGRLLAFYRSEGNAVAQALRKPAEELTREDALHLACAAALDPQAYVRGLTKLIAAAGFATTMEWFAAWMTEDPLQR
jgi:glycine/D-amino acid oxidase-like deaminating enzyme